MITYPAMLYSNIWNNVIFMLYSIKMLFLRYIQVQQMVLLIYMHTLAIECEVLKTFIKILAQQILHSDFIWQIKRKS